MHRCDKFERNKMIFLQTPFAWNSMTSSSLMLRKKLYLFTRTSTMTSYLPDPSLVCTNNAPSDFNCNSAVVYKDFVTSDEALLLENDIKNRMKRRRYEKGHWDSVITSYKEVELADNSFQDDDVPKLLKKVRQHLADNHLMGNYYDHKEFVRWLPCHAIDMKKDGELNAHVDSVRFSGELVAGLSFLSSSIMRLVPCGGDDGDDKNCIGNDDNPTTDADDSYVDLLLPPKSLYVLTGVGRYKYSHQILPDSSVFCTSLHNGTPTKEIIVRRDHRFSVIFRDAKREKAS